SAEIARDFLKSENADEELINEVSRCILATKFNANEPADILEKIIKDADTSHLAKGYFEETSEFLRQELKLQNIKNYSPQEWIEENIKLFTQLHKFHTSYALKNWQKKKDENLLMLLEKDKSHKS